MAELSRMAVEKIAKEQEMLKIMNALEGAGFPIERVNDFGTLAYMVSEGDLEDRFITIKVVLTKEYKEEGKGFDINEAAEEYELKLKKEKEKSQKAKKS